MKKLVKVLIVSAVLVGVTAPVSAVSICDVEATSFDVWFIQHMIC